MTTIRQQLLTLSSMTIGRGNRVSSKAAMMSYSSSTFLMMKAEDAKPAFDQEKSAMYEKMARNHHHENGPWTTMVDTVVALANTNTNTGSSDIHLLDLATGPGEPAAHIAKALPHVRVIATDISEDQVAIAEKVCSELDNIEVCPADMQDLSQFPDNHFDLVTCCYGFMFPPDIDAAVKEAHRVLKPGGSLVATTWNKIPFLELQNRILEQITQAPLPVPPINPLSLCEPGLFHSLLQGGGFVDIRASDHEYPFDFTKDPEFQLKAIFMIHSALLNDLDGGWDKARVLLEQEKTNFGRVNDIDGHLIVDGNEYKLSVASKPLS